MSRVKRFTFAIHFLLHRQNSFSTVPGLRLGRPTMPFAERSGESVLECPKIQVYRFGFGGMGLLAAEESDVCNSHSP
jgi:hypothetical protein